MNCARTGFSHFLQCQIFENFFLTIFSTAFISADEGTVVTTLLLISGIDLIDTALAASISVVIRKSGGILSATLQFPTGRSVSGLRSSRDTLLVKLESICGRKFCLKKSRVFGEFKRQLIITLFKDIQYILSLKVEI